MMYPAPKCLSCSLLNKVPTKIGEKASCSKYKKIPDGTFFKGGACAYYKEKKRG